MGIFSRRPRPSQTAQVPSSAEKPDTEKEANENIDFENEEIPTFEQNGVTFARLITASDNGEEAVIESILRSAGIPYVIREQSGESWMRVMMGYNFFGVDFYVPENLLDDATELIMPDGDEEDFDGDGDDTDGE